MSVTLARAASAYQQVQVTSRSPLELVVLLYDGALASLAQARTAMERRDLHAKARAMTKTMAIVHELQSTLNFENGRDVAVNLDRLYTFVTARLVDANIRLDPAPLDEAERVLVSLRDAWAQVATAPVSKAG